jgi:hypothetical protein
VFQKWKNREKSFAGSRGDAVRNWCVRTGKRVGRYQRSYPNGNVLFDPATQLIYAIGAVVGLIGGVKVYNKFSSGDPDTSKTAASWFGACIFLIVAATILRSFFL